MAAWSELGRLHGSPGRSCRILERRWRGVHGLPSQVNSFMQKAACTGSRALAMSSRGLAFPCAQWTRELRLHSGSLWVLGWAGFPAKQRAETQRFFSYCASFCSFCTPLNICVYTYFHLHGLPSPPTWRGPGIIDLSFRRVLLS